jgi:hypothetical protein
MRRISRSSATVLGQDAVGIADEIPIGEKEELDEVVAGTGGRQRRIGVGISNRVGSHVSDDLDLRQ